MSATVSLREVVDHLGIISDELISYVNRETGAVVTVSKEDLSQLEAAQIDDPDYLEWQHEALHEAQSVLSSEEFVALPSKFDIHEYAIIQEFCHSITDGELRNLLLDKIHGSGAFRRFKNAIHQRDIADDWYRFRDKALKEIAVDWLERIHMAYTDDTERPMRKRG